MRAAGRVEEIAPVEKADAADVASAGTSERAEPQTATTGVTVDLARHFESIATTPPCRVTTRWSMSPIWSSMLPPDEPLALRSLQLGARVVFNPCSSQLLHRLLVVREESGVEQMNADRGEPCVSEPEQVEAHTTLCPYGLPRSPNRDPRPRMECLIPGDFRLSRRLRSLREELTLLR